MRRFQEALFVRSQVSATRIPGLWWQRKEERVRQIRGPKKRKYLRTAAHEHARNADRLALRRMWRAAAEPCGPGRAMPEMRVRSARLQTVRALRSIKPLRMQSADSRQNLSQR